MLFVQMPISDCGCYCMFTLRHCRLAYEMALIMPDNKTVYAGDDGAMVSHTYHYTELVKPH
jgi:hypothetical protein